MQDKSKEQEIKKLHENMEIIKKMNLCDKERERFKNICSITDFS